MRRLMKTMAAAATAAVLSCLLSATALAATAAISSVTIRVGTDVQAGEEAPDSIDTISDSLETRDGTYAATNSDKYEVRDAEWTSSTTSERELAVGDEPKMKVFLSTTGYYSGDREYIFRGGYSSGNVTVKGGTFVSARVVDGGDGLEITVKMNGIKGQYPTPDDAYWKGSGYGNAVWVMDSDNRKIASGYYDVYLYRGSSIVKRLEAFKGTSYNFYPYMTKKGNYYFKVRVVPFTESEKKYGTKGEWLDSDEVYVDESHVSDGTGQTDGNGLSTSTTNVGWIQDGGFWYFRYPDSSYQKNGWLKVNEKWYLFDGTGKMLTGWQTKDGHTYFLKDSGDMLTGWIKGGEKWYYLNPAIGGPEGAMYKGWLTLSGKTYYMDSNGAMLEGWHKVEDNWYYFYPESGYKATNTYIQSFYVDNNGIWRK